MPSLEWETDVGDRAQCLNEVYTCRITGGVADLAGETTGINVREAGDSLMIRLNSSAQQYWDPA